MLSKDESLADPVPRQLDPVVLRQLIAIRRERRARSAQRAEESFYEAAAKAREGDPWPFVELQWGKVLRADDIVDNGRSRIAEAREEHGRVLILDGFQEDLIGSLFDPTIREVYVKGNTGCGKGGASAIGICVYYAIHPASKIVITRDSYKTAVTVMFGEVSKWWRRMAWRPPGVELMTSALIELENRQHYCQVASPDSDEGFSGVHAERVLFVFDEATAPNLEERYSLAETQATDFLALANPRTTSGNFRRAFTVAEDADKTQTVNGPYGRRRLITIAGADCLNVRLECISTPVSPKGGIEIGDRYFKAGELIPPQIAQQAAAVIPGQTNYDEYQGHCSNPDPRWVRVFAHGQFPDEDPEKQLIRGIWLSTPVRAWGYYQDLRRRAADRANSAALIPLLDAWHPVESFGLDVGGSTHGDPSVLTAGGRRGIRDQFEAQMSDAEELSDWVLGTIDRQYDLDLRDGAYPIAVDVDGIGWGVAGILRRAGCHVIEIRGNATGDADPRRYTNKRAEGYGELARRLDPAGDWTYELYKGDDQESDEEFRDRWKRRRESVFLLPDSESLLAELKAHEKIYARDGFRFAVTPKRRAPGVKNQAETITEKIGRSPDRSDSAVYWYRAQQVVGISLEDALDAGFF